MTETGIRIISGKMEDILKEKIKLLKEGKLSEEEFYKIIEHYPYKDIGEKSWISTEKSEGDFQK